MPNVAETADAQGDLYLMPGKVKLHRFQFAILPEDVGRKLEVQFITRVLPTNFIFHLNIAVFLERVNTIPQNNCEKCGFQ